MIHATQTFLVNNFTVYLVLIALISYFLFKKREKTDTSRLLVHVSWTVLVVWFTRKMHIDSYMPTIMSEAFSDF